MKNVVKFFAGAVLALVCGGMLAGCSSLFEEDSHKEWNYREIRKIVGFLDDSLVIVRDVRRWYEVSDENGDFLDGGWGHHALYLYNYRVQEDGPRWMDSLDNGFNDDFGYFKGQMTDSVVWGSDGNLWSFWKVYDKPYKVTINEMYEDCLVAFEITSVKQWFDETFIARGDGSLNAGGDSCQYAVLDTVARTITYKRLDENLKWVRQCDDVRAWGEDVYCLILDDEDGYSVVLINGKDTIPSLKKFYIGGFWGSMIKMNGNICSVKNDTISCSDVTWRGNEVKFYRGDEVVVEY